MSSIYFSFPIEPAGKERPRVIQRNGRSMAYTPLKTRQLEATIRDFALAEMLKQRFGKIEAPTPVKAAIVAVFHVPDSYPKKRKAACLAGLEAPTKKPDTDNIAKLVLDSLNGLAYDDDAQIIELSVTKVYGEQAKVNLMLS
ncbi:MAG: RusA family crossover junction endodeoxyribonuclease, partial [Exiguobacterium sp.]|nr:RusA family crossover junction endodeoxyribonuclease [Exiguobacterium sp.]